MKTEKFAEINNVGYDKAIKLATLSLDKIERLAKLNLDTAKTVLANGTQNAGAITAVKDVPSLLALNAKFAEAGMKDVVGYSRAVYAIASEAQSELSALTEDAFAAYTLELGAWVEKASKNAPAGSDVAVNALKSTVAATTAMFDQVSKATKEAASFADASVRAATANAAKIAKAATQYDKAA